MPTTDRCRDERGGVRGFLLGLTVVVAVFAVVGVLMYEGVGPFPEPEGCTARAGGVTVDLSIEQAENASVIAAVGIRRGLPARAVSIAVATAYQEIKQRNLDHGDRDSVGLFQQRPSMGWGSVHQLTNPYYASNAFYDELVKVDGFRHMRITDAAQKVQRSGFPEAYEDHASDARAVASALTGYSPARFSCVVHRPHDLAAQEERRSGLTPRAAKVRRGLERAFGHLALGGFAPGGVTDGHMKGSAHYDGRAIDVFVRPVDEANNRLGWAIAQYLVAQAHRLEIEHVIFDQRIWTTGALSEKGWRHYRPPERSGNRATLEHRDHVHVDVLAGG
jgi:hypothetical protein